MLEIEGEGGGEVLRLFKALSRGCVVTRMHDKHKTKEQLIKEITELRQYIAELKRADKERKKETLRGSEEERREIMDSVRDGIVLLDLTGKVTTINKRITETAGYTEKDIIGKRFKLLKMFPSKSITTMLTDFARIISGQQPPPYEVEVSTKKGEKLFIEIQGSLLRERGKKAGVVAVLRDITERKRAEEELQRHREHIEESIAERTATLQATNEQLQREIIERKQMERELRESEEKYRELINGMNDTAWVIDFDGKFIDVNDAAVEVLGYSREELFTMGPYDIDSSLDAKKITGLIKRMRKDKLQVFETTHTSKDGKTIPVEIKSSLVTYQGKQAILSIARDITERKRMEEALREREEHYRILVDNIRFGINLIDTDHTIMMVNAAQEKYFKKPRAQFVGKKCFHEFEKRDAVCSHCPAVWAIATKKPAEVETVLTADDGSHFHARIQAFPIFGKDGTVTSFIEIAEIITERKQMEEALRESEERFRLLVEHSKDTFLLHDLDGNIVDVNQHACESLGYTREELLHLNIQDIDQDFVNTQYLGRWKQMVSGEPITVEGIHRRKDGTTFPVEVRLGVLESGGRRLMLGLVRDITERIRAEETIRKLAYHDALTGLPNRVLFANRLNRAMAQAHHNQSKFAVMSLDLDYFKDVNDTLGHSVGDQLLHHVGKRLTGLLRKNDTVSRTGGDEFFLLLPEITLTHDVATIAQKVLNAFNEPFMCDEHKLTITTSIGVAMYPDDGEDADTLLKHSDIALYHAKQKGRNNYQRYTAVMEAKFLGQARSG